jgi:acyl carrier protein
LAAESIDVGRVKEIIALVCGRSPAGRQVTASDIGDDLPLYSLDGDEPSLGLDSLDALELATELEETFDLVLPTEIDPLELRTVRDVVALLERLLAEQREA